MEQIIKLISYLGFLSQAHAQSSSGGGLCPGYIDALCRTNLSQIADNIIKFLFDLGAPIASIMVLWGGFQIMTAGGDPEKFRKGRQTILYAAIGLVVILLAQSVKDLIFGIFGVR